MKDLITRSGALCVGLGLTIAIGCASGDAARVSDAQLQLQEKQRELDAAQAALREREDRISQLEEETLPAVSAPAPSQLSASADLLPPAAKPGECYARVFVPPTYTTRTIDKLQREAAEEVEVIPARYETVRERVLVKEASERLEVVPATYGWVEERVLVKEASSRLEEVPATYAWKEEQVLVRPAETVWKKGRGPIEKIDDATGEIMCLVEVPAEYKTVRTRVLKTPATTRRVEIPAEYKTVKRRVLKSPATTRTVSIPAEYRTVEVRRLVEPAREQRVALPAVYQKVTQRELATEGRMDWRPVLCETNATTETVVAIQRALRGAGHDPGPIDGVIGRQTLDAVQSFQHKKGLARGGLTYATIEALGVRVGR